MAGIGFQLKKMLRKESYGGVLEAYAYAAVISSGPWILSILSLAVLGIVLSSFTRPEESTLFFVSVTHVIAVSLILTGPIQLVVSRYAADQLFIEKPERVFSSYVTSLFVTAAISAVLGLILFGLFGFGPPLHRFATALFLVLISMVWLSTTYLSALKRFRVVVLAFFVGYGSSFAMAALATWYAGPDGPSYTMAGFVIGQMILVFILFRVIAAELGASEIFNFECLTYFHKHPHLVLVGFFYNFGLWIDKFIYWWFSPQNIYVGGIYYACPMYDIAVYLSFLSIAPGMAVFLIKLEADFALKMEELTRCIIRKAPLARLERLNDEIIEASREGLTLQIKLQAMITALLLVASTQISEFVGIGELQTGVFEITLLGVAIFVVFLSLLTILFYLERMKEALLCCLTFTLINAITTAINVQDGEQYYGLGFSLAALVVTLMALVFVNRSLQGLIFRLFREQEVDL